MKRTTKAVTGLVALTAILVLGVFSAGSASAHEFLWTGPLPGLLLILSDNTQVFHVTSEFAINCKHFGGHGILSNGSSMSIATGKITGKYSSCKTMPGEATATISPVEYELSASGTVGVIGQPIVITIASLNCSVKVSNGGPNGSLSQLLYLNQTSDLLVHAEVSGIHSIGSGSSCGPAGKEQTEGSYFGLLLVWVDGGTIRWD